MQLIRDLIAAINALTAAINALRQQMGGGATTNGDGGPGEEN